MSQAIVTIVLVAIITGVPAILWIIHAGLKHEERKIQLAKGADGEEVARLNAVVGQLSADMVKLKDRVQVLEKLATDDDRRLSAEIAGLRDART